MGWVPERAIISGGAVDKNSDNSQTIKFQFKVSQFRCENNYYLKGWVPERAIISGGAVDKIIDNSQIIKMLVLQGELVQV